MSFFLTAKNALEQVQKMQKRFAALKYLNTHTVDVGLPSTASGHSRFLLGIHEHGSPIMHIPARPVVQPALAQTDVKGAMRDAMKSGLSAAMDGDMEGTKAALETAGQAGADGIRAYIDADVSPPNSPVTVSGGWIYNRVAKVGVPVAGKGFNKPLIRTGELYNDFGYEIKSK